MIENKTKTLILLCLIGCTLGVVLLSLHAGPAPLSWSEIFNWLSGQDISDQARLLLGSLRGPRTAAAFFIGASLAACGLVLQTLLKNPLAEPYTLGLSGASSLGALTALFLALEPLTFWVPALSTVGCFTATFLVLSLAQTRLGFESRTLILFGVMISLFFGALTVFGLSILSPQKVQAGLFWLLGELGTSRDIWITMIAPLLALGIMILFLKAPALDALILGDARTLSLGYSPKRERTILIVVCTFLTALGVSISGLVGFVGLVCPHVARKLLRTANHRWLLAGSIFLGATLLIGADTLGRTVAGTTEIPAGSIAAMIGAPVLIFLLLRDGHASAD